MSVSQQSAALSFALVNTANKNKHFALNKDLNGGYGTADDYSGFLVARAARFIKRSSVRLPVISFAYVQAILKEKGFEVKYFEDTLPQKQYDVIFLRGSIVDYRNENDIARRLKEQFPESKVGFFGEFPAVRPDLFDRADFILCGEIEAFLMHDFKSTDDLKGQVKVSALTDYDDLPTLDLTGFPLNKYRYSFSLFPKRFMPIQGSKGCPYSCSFYCTYGQAQGPKIRQRSAKKLVDDIVALQDQYGIKVIQFRDPVFGLKKGFMEEFSKELRDRGVDITWGMETRLDLLNEENISTMYAAGLRHINAGIETNDAAIAKRNKRLLVEESHQERIVRFCAHKGIQVSAFYILGLEADTPETINKTIDYAISLNTPVARFGVSTPYPGTRFFDQLKEEGRILTDDYELYTQFNLVYKHEHLTPKQIKSLLSSAYRRYYWRWSFISRKLNWNAYFILVTLAYLIWRALIFLKRIN